MNPFSQWLCHLATSIALACLAGASTAQAAGNVQSPSGATTEKPSGAATELPTLRIHDGGMERTFLLTLDAIGLRQGEQRTAVPTTAANPTEWRRHAQTLTEQNPGAEAEWIAYEEGRKLHPRNRRFLTRELLVECLHDANRLEVARDHGLTMGPPQPHAPEWQILLAASAVDVPEALDRLRHDARVLQANPMLARLRARKLTPNDPLFPIQWHHRNETQGGGALWIDANVTSVWNRYRGKGITIGIIDDGVQHTHPDLTSNYNASLDYDFNGIDSDPTPGNLTTDSHGTACAGVAAATGGNGIGVSGTAPAATLTGYRLIALETTDRSEADAFAIRNDVVQIKSNSWGAPDDGETVEGPGPLATAALANGTTNGRGGLGTIYVFAGGNGHDFGDNSNYDGYANSIHTIAVGAINDRGFQSWFSERGANLHVCAPSTGSKSSQGIITTDLTGNSGENSTTTGADDLPDRNYTRNFSGTSAAAPAVAGVCALMLEANPNLGWRDVQEILLRTARMVHHTDPDWAVNAAGLHFNHKYGAGMVDANAAVTLAERWTNLGPQALTQVAQTGLSVAIPDNQTTGISRTFTVNDATLRVEQVEVILNINHARRGDLEISLTSPGGTRSLLAEQHPDPGDHYANWTFTSVRHWGETAAGTWTLTIRDLASSTTGTLTAATLKVHGSRPSTTTAVPTAVVLTKEDGLPANGAADPGERVTVALTLKNPGSTALTGLLASLIETGGVSDPFPPRSLGDLAPGASVTRDFTFTARGAAGGGARILLELTDATGNRSWASCQLPLGTPSTTTFQGAAVNLPDNRPGDPYPALARVNTPAGRVQNVAATLQGFSHGYPRDLTVFLTGPADLGVALFTDATTTTLTARDLTFDDNARVHFPRSGATPSASYRPWDAAYFETGEGTYFDGGASIERGYSLGEFNGLDPQGDWKLHAEDGSAGDSGSLNSWKLSITTVGCTDNISLPDPSVRIDETAGELWLTVRRGGGSEGTATVECRTEPGSAQPGQDYQPVAETLTFSPGVLEQTVRIPLVNDGPGEPEEQFSVALTLTSGPATNGNVMKTTVTLTNSAGNPLAGWRLEHFGSPADAGDGANLNDFDADGLANLVEYAFYLDPRRDSSGSLPTLQWIDNRWTLEFTGREGVSYGAEWSRSMNPDVWAPLTNEDTPPKHRFTLPEPLPTLWFFRLKVTE